VKQSKPQTKHVQSKHAARRKVIAEIVVRLVSKYGLEGVTIRSVAVAAGYSTTVVTHYFKSKNDLLLATYQWISERSYDRVYKALDSDPTDLQGFFAALLFIDHPEYWKAYLAFWALALVDPMFQAEQERRGDDVQHMIVALLNRRVSEGLPVARQDYHRVARYLILAVQGFGIQSILHGKDWPMSEKKDFIHRVASWVTAESPDEPIHGIPGAQRRV
jgi:AcrR family transcriptional regulator